MDSQLEALPADDRPTQVVFAVVTDGLENASAEWSRDKVMATVKDHIGKGWHFTFLGANQDAIAEGGNVGVPQHASLTYAATSQGARAAMESLSSSVARIRSAPGPEGMSFTEQERRRSDTG